MHNGGMELWIILAIGAAFLQTVRFMLQKHLSKVTLSASGATFARFLYSAPVAVLICTLFLTHKGQGVPNLANDFPIYAVIGAFAQITATVCTVLLFGRRNFAVGLTFTKTAVLMSVPVGWIWLGDSVSAIGLLAITIGFFGVIVLSGPIDSTDVWWRRLISPSAALGLAGGALFSVSGVAYRGATLAVQSPDPFERSLVTLAIVTSLQLTSMALWLYIRDRAEIKRVVGAWRSASFIGLTSLGGSFGWFSAYTLENAAYVNAVGQVEVIFGIIATMLFFREKITTREFFGIALITVSVLGLIIWR